MIADPPHLTVIGGYLGAGKTTLLNNLLRTTSGSRIAVLVNDFGEINIDADLIESADGETIALTNGCTCCTLADGLSTVLAGLRERPDDFDHIVFEASGVADPLRIGHTGAAFGFPLDGVIIVADAELIRSQSMDKYVGDTVLRQLRGADLLVVNKTDLVSPAGLESVRTWLAETAPDVPAFTTEGGLVDTALLLGPLRASDGAATHAGTHDEFDSWSYRTDTPLLREDVEAFLTALPAGVVRAKGILRLTDDPANDYLLHRVGTRTSLVPRSNGDPGGAGESRLVVIGVPGSIDGERFAQRLKGAR